MHAFDSGAHTNTLSLCRSIDVGGNAAPLLSVYCYNTTNTEEYPACDEHMLCNSSRSCSSCYFSDNSNGVVCTYVCNAGWTGPDGGIWQRLEEEAEERRVWTGRGGTCTACVAGKYKSTLGTASCTDCGAGTYSAAVGASASSACIACPSNSYSPAGSAALKNCTCNAGYHQEVATVTCSGSCLCQPSAGTSSGSISVGSMYENNMNCTWLIAYNGVISLSFSSLNTKSGYDFVTINRCTSSWCGTVEEVAKLSGNSVSSSTIYTSSTGYMQVLFISNTTKETSVIFDDNTTNETSDNTTNNTTNETSNNTNNTHIETSGVVVIYPGFEASWSIPSPGMCTACVAGKYQASKGSADCIACPSNSESPAGSAALNNCTCNAGFSGNDGGPCSVCQDDPDFNAGYGRCGTYAPGQINQDYCVTDGACHRCCFSCATSCGGVCCAIS